MKLRVFGPRSAGICVALAMGLAGLSIADAAGTVTNCASYGSPGTPGDLAWALSGGGRVTFTCSGTIVVPEIHITANTTVDATGQTVALSGNNVNRVFNVYLRALELVNLTVTGGYTPTNGGGIYAVTSQVTLTNSTLSNNTACCQSIA